MCKIEPVQSELAFIRGFEGVFSTLSSEYSSIDDKNTCKIRSMDFWQIKSVEDQSCS
jgi:hypothetical protein